MGWATHAINQLKAGKAVILRPRGYSMKGKVDDGDTVVVSPCSDIQLKVGDIVLCRVRGKEYLHLIKAINGDRVLIGNNLGQLNGWIHRRNVFGIVVAINPIHC